MFNLRTVDSTFAVSGGWQDVPRDVDQLLAAKIKFILDLQFTPTDDVNFSIPFIREQLLGAGIDYTYRPLYDGDYGQKIQSFWEDTNKVLESFEELLPTGHRILVKCSAGMSRSPATLMAYYGESKGLTFRQSREILLAADRRAEWPMSVSPFFEAELKRIYGSGLVPTAKDKHRLG